MFSVVIPLYNKVSTVKRAVESVLNQTVAPVEIIIVNDGSTDGGELIVGQMRASCIRLINQENAGVSTARNRGIKEAVGEIVAFLDADDEWDTCHLEIHKRLYDQFPSATVAGSAYRYFMMGKPVPNLLRINLSDDFEGMVPNYFSVAAYGSPPLWTSTVSAKRVALERIGGFPAIIRSGEDLLTWARLAVDGAVVYSMKSSAVYYRDCTRTAAGRPTDRSDLVGDGLKELLPVLPSEMRSSLKKYLGFWYKMRSSTFMRHGEFFPCLYSTAQSLFFYPYQIRITLYPIASMVFKLKQMNIKGTR